MNFSTNYDDLNEFELIPEGIYETVVKSAEEAVTKGGTGYIDVRLVIRNDVEQPQKDRYIFHKIWKKKEPSERDLQVGGYSFAQLMSFANAAKIPAGKNYGSIAEICADFVGKCVKVEIQHDTYKNRTSEKVAEVSASGYPECRHKFKSSVTAQTYKPPVNDAFAQPSPLPAGLNDFEEILPDSDLPF